MRVYNYFSRRMEDFVPIHENRVGMYVCGPTVYSDAHLGHARSALTFDMFYRYLSHKGYQVRYVRNITDVGHLEDEEYEQGEDKIEKMARMSRMEPMEIAHYYTMQYHRVMNKLSIKSPSIEPFASGHIMEQQEYIEKLLSKGYAYEVNGNIYFDIAHFLKSFNTYGTLSGKKIDELLANQRALKNQDHKRSPNDFALWKTVSESQIMHWKSPWTEKGVPGWHTECSVMSEKYLGHPFDIHGGGLDLQFPHHEAELAQSMAIHGSVPAKYWLYNNMITIDKKKMSKSLQNFITLDMFFEGSHKELSQAYSPELIRFFLLRSHYRSVLEVSDESLRGALAGMTKLVHASIHMQQILSSAQVGGDNIVDIKGTEAMELSQSLMEHLDDDMNTPAVIAVLFNHVQRILAIDISSPNQDELSLVQVYYYYLTHILGLSFQARDTMTVHKDVSSVTETLITEFLQIRAHARSEKNFALSDRVREVLQKLGITIKDSSNGSSSWSFTDKVK